MNTSERAQLEKQLEQAQAALAEQRASMPAHTVRPAQLQELEDLEEQVEDLRARLQSAKGGECHG
jgi:uncharacterized membrane-anchored protein YhcB (DUF1043 family)